MQTPDNVTSAHSPDQGASAGPASPVDPADTPSAAESPGSVEAYSETLRTYLTSRSDEALHQGSLLSQRFVDAGLGPAEIVAIHAEAVDAATAGLGYRERARASTDALSFLLEVMIVFGMQYRAYLDLRLRERDREIEARLALERQRTLDAEQSERDKEAILATISHELRTPITAAMGNVDLARRSLDRQQLERLPRQLTAAREALGRLTRLTDDLVGAGHDGLPAMVLLPIDCGEVLRQACLFARPLADEEAIALVVDDLGPCEAVGDADALLTVFGNLLTNAIRYTPEGGRVEARLGFDGAWAWFSVIDTGIGMTPETQAKIFEKFYRAPDARRAEPRGLGLGLSIAQRLVAAHHGRLEIESQPGQGSTFRLWLPRR